MLGGPGRDEHPAKARTDIRSMQPQGLPPEGWAAGPGVGGEPASATAAGRGPGGEGCISSLRSRSCPGRPAIQWRSTGVCAQVGLTCQVGKLADAPQPELTPDGRKACSGLLGRGTENLGTLGSPMVVLSHFASKVPASPGRLRGLCFLLDLLRERRLRELPWGRLWCKPQSLWPPRLSSVPAFPPFLSTTATKTSIFLCICTKVLNRWCQRD